MQHYYSIIKHAGKIGAFTTLFTFGWVNIAQAKCPDQFYSAVTDPADVPANYTGKVTEFKLPSNVCVRRYSDNEKSITENFATSDFAVVNGSQIKLHKPFSSGIFESWASYEPILGHFHTNYDYTDSNNPRHPDYKNYSGSHPVMISKSANAIVIYQNGQYLIGKQTIVRGFAGRCPEGYSTVGDSNTCYSKTNALQINGDDKLELVELKNVGTPSAGYECPLGFATAIGLGSNRGICTSVKAINEGVANFGLSVKPNSARCIGGEFTKDGITCLPVLTAVACNISAAEATKFNNRLKPSNPYKAGKYAFYWPTTMVNKQNALIDFNQNYSNITSHKVSITNLRNASNALAGDDGNVVVAGSDSGNFPAFYLDSKISCDKLWDNGGWSAEPQSYAD